MDKNNPSDQLKTSKIYNPDVKYKYIINRNCFWRARIGRLKMYRLCHQHIVKINDYNFIALIHFWCQIFCKQFDMLENMKFMIRFNIFNSKAQSYLKPQSQLSVPLWWSCMCYGVCQLWLIVALKLCRSDWECNAREEDVWRSSRRCPVQFSLETDNIREHVLFFTVEHTKLDRTLHDLIKYVYFKNTLSLSLKVKRLNAKIRVCSEVWKHVIWKFS